MQALPLLVAVCLPENALALTAARPRLPIILISDIDDTIKDRRDVASVPGAAAYRKNCANLAASLLPALVLAEFHVTKPPSTPLLTMNLRPFLALTCLATTAAFAADLPTMPAESIAKKRKSSLFRCLPRCHARPVLASSRPTFAVENGTLKSTQMRDQNIPAADGKPAIEARAAVHGFDKVTLIDERDGNQSNALIEPRNDPAAILASLARTAFSTT